METLANYIIERLKIRPSCTVFKQDLARIFPAIEKEAEKRHAAIRKFAEERGWDVIISDPGIRATFRPKRPLSRA